MEDLFANLGSYTIRRMWLDNGFRSVRVVGKARGGKYYIEWCNSGKWRKLRSPVPESELMSLHFDDMPVSALASPLPDAPVRKARRIRRKR